MFKFSYEFPETHTPFNRDILEKRLVDLKYKNLFEPLFTAMSCDNPDHDDFTNEVTIYVTEPPSFVTNQMCCNDFERKIKKALM